RLAGVEKKSCRAIADRLNALSVPCAYVRDAHLGLGINRKKTSGFWRAGRVLRLLNNKTYMGIHEFGKRTRKRELIRRAAPAIVSEETWRNAQETLSAHFMFGIRTARSKYLLRSLIKCGKCGLTYVGFAANRRNQKHEFYYRCNGSNCRDNYSVRGKCE